MKALLKIVLTMAVAVGVVGCGTLGGAAAGGAIDGKRGAVVGAVAGAAYDHYMATERQRENVRYRSYVGSNCDPVDADRLMDWAKGVDGEKYHRRDARVERDSYQGVRCSSREEAGSRTERRLK